MRLAQILTRPRETMRAILEQPRDRAAIPLILAAAFVSSLGDANLPAARKAVAVYPTALVWLVVVGVAIGAALVSLAMFYLFAWIATLIGRLFDGQGNARALRSAIAWGLVPVIWAFPYRLLTFFFSPARDVSSGRMVIDLDRFASGCGWAVATILVELLVIGGCVWVASNTVAEAHRFSTMRGFATFFLSVISPLVVAAAAVLTALF